MACKRCRERGQTWRGSPPVCGFNDNGSFNPKNWNCATLNGLRDLCDLQRLPETAPGGYIYHEDYRVGIIPGRELERGADFVILRWYKSRGRTEHALTWDTFSDVPRPITLPEAQWTLEAHGL